jgi:energy-coupling factor transporter ATP-binding protein EcfA2
MEAQDRPTDIAYPRGSEWRRWDLHVHTPYSALNNGFGDNFDTYARAVFQAALEKQIAVIGVTDYFSIRGYQELRKLQEDQQKLVALLGEEDAMEAGKILLLPNIELRLRDLVRVGEKEARINLHLIFSNEVPSQDIEDKFLRRLEFTSESAPDTPDERESLTEANLEGLGKRLKKQHEGFGHESDLKVGMAQAVITHEQITEVLEKTRVLDKRHLLLVAADEDLSDISWDGQGHLTRKLLIQKAHMLFSSNAGTHEFGLGGKHASREAFEEEFKSLKPCVHGSDAHDPQGLFVFAEDRQLWIRANPSFDGLAQLLLGPGERVYVGPEPPALKRVRDSATRSIKEIRIGPVGAQDPDARWFSGSVSLNPGLVAIIGKKGSGKSALADIAGLLGNSQNADDFSFLNKQRFLNPKHRLGERFQATLRWRSGDEREMKLSEPSDPLLPERVKYIPQSHLEEICAEIQDSSSPTLFDQELEAVIFSHVPIADRLGYERLPQLVEHTTEQTAGRIVQLQGRLGKVNGEYLELRRRGSRDARKTLEAALAKRQAELDAHEKTRPAEVPEPKAAKDHDSGNAATREELAKVVAKIETLDGDIRKHSEGEAEAKKRLVAVERLQGRIENLRETLRTFQEESAEDATLLGLDVTALVRLEGDTSELEKLQKTFAQEIGERTELLDRDRPGSLTHRRADASKKAEELRRKLSAPERRRQEYERALKAWQRTRAAILGSAEARDSIKGLEARREALAAIPTEAAAKRDERTTLVREIFGAKEKLVEEYERLYAPVQDFIDRHAVAREVEALSFSAAVSVDRLEDGILAMINQRKRGSFSGDHEGRERLRELIARHDFASADGVVAFLDELGENLEKDQRRGAGGEAVELADQLVQAADPASFYAFIFGLDYLRPRFELLWRDKPLGQLSPGERGTLLLIFYLLIDKDDTPLIIDQPEENLDNETVAKLLVPAVRYAKERRQIILVTHNPNLAVVCDADQIVHADFNKADGNRVTYTSGAIEAPVITQLIVDVLEGTKPAFDFRDAKYDVLDRVKA